MGARQRPPLATALAVLLAGPLVAANAQTWDSGLAFPDATQPRLAPIGLTLGGEVLAVGGSPYLNGGDSDCSSHGLIPGGAWVEHAWLEGPIIDQGGGIDALGRIIVFGGKDGIDPEGDEGGAYVYDLDQGKQGNVPDRSSLAPATGFAWCTDHQGRIYSIGGGPGSQGGNSTRVERYDAPTNTWQVVPPLPSARSGAAAVVAGDGRILVIGGFGPSGGQPLASILVLDPATDLWTSGDFTDLPVGLSGARAALGADGRIYVVGGRSAGFLIEARTWVLDPAANAWVAGPDLQIGRYRFGLTLGPDQRLYALGGSDGNGGTHTVETLYTPTCPSVVSGGVATPWVGMDGLLEAFVAGGPPFDLRWEKDGQPLFDGPAAGGGSYVGADTSNLRIDGVGLADAGSYRLVATNGCGTDSGDPVVLAPHESPALGPYATIQSFGVLSSAGSTGVASDGPLVVGQGSAPAPPNPDQPQALVWNAEGQLVANLTPSNSVGSGVADVEQGSIVGWWWWPYTTTQGTGYYQHAARWDADTLQHHEMQPSGWEIGSISDTDGTGYVGTLRFDESSTNGDGAYWPGGSTSFVKLTPPEFWGSGASAIDGGHQYGSAHLGFGVVHAMRWSGSAASYEDFGPEGAGYSAINGARDGQAVGQARFSGVDHAQLWGVDADDRVDLHPASATSSSASDCDGGIQLGVVVTTGVGSRPVLWRGTAEDRVDLYDLLTSGPWESAQANDVEVADCGLVAVTGSGYDSDSGTYTPLQWRFQPRSMVAEPTELSVATGGTQDLWLALGSEYAGSPYLVLGSSSGTSPGLPLAAGVVLPLVPDGYTTWTLGQANGAVFDDTLGTLSSFGGAHGAIVLPGGLPPTLAGTSLHHAAIFFGAGGAIDQVSEAEPLVLGP
ncbi:kelch repeat-containing protein [Engelhardtia mirabilis]|uniref:Kelch motif protein n=1 Tax=Engelhardtia mirabilis TaxID=2528011 RepID=A0A518BNV8_9BACT|nr:Kelch motif protein [Planctomycetes bacterium Pla133]QDV02988.1 Kelch motif protein [Planctomycetes bacterium Pla86]